MEGDSLETEQFDEGGGEQVLGSVLLHMIHAARPINLAVDGTGGNFGCGVVDHVVGIAWIGDVWPSGGVRSVNNFYDLRIA